MSSREYRVPKVLSALLSAFAWVATAFLTAFLFIFVTLLALPFTLLLDPRKRRFIHWISIVWARLIIAVIPFWRFHLEGLGNIKPGKNYVVVANHQSLLDILVLLAALPLNFKFIAKQELFDIPFIGWHMYAAGYVPVDRASGEARKKAFLRARENLKAGASVLLFPEGTRSLDRKIHPFKGGAFRLAQDEGLEVLPVVIDGTGDAVPKKSWRLKKRTDLHVSVGGPVRIQGEGAKAAEEIESIRREMMNRLAGIRRNKKE